MDSAPLISPTARRLLLAAVAAIFLAHAFIYRAYLIDDAYISLRYAENLVAGHGLVFNPGATDATAERVEGYTNFAWVLLGALFLRLGIDAMLGWKIVSALATGWLLWSVRRLQAITGDVGPSALLWLLPLAGFGYWATTGMETMLFAALLTAGVARLLAEERVGRRRGSVVLFVLLALTRPEGVALFALAHAAAALASRLAGGGWGLRRRLVDVGIFTAAYGAYFLWRWRYYGELLPNTFYAKVTGGAEQPWNGLINLADWARTMPLLALAMLAPAMLFLARRRWLLGRPGIFAVTTIAAGLVAYIVAVGGDFMPFLRFFLPVLPLAAVLFSWLVGTLLRGLDTAAAGRAWAIAALVAIHTAAGWLGDETYRAFVAHRTTVVGLEVGRFFGEERQAEDLLAVNTAGAVPWASALPTLDMLGLTDKTIARHPIYVISPTWAGHRRGWGDHVLSRRPAVVLWYNAAGLGQPHYLGDHQLADSPGFRFFYQQRTANLTTDEDPERPLARFLGRPFGDHPSGSMTAPDLGVRFVLVGGPARTVAYPAPIRLIYFERRAALDALWDAYLATDGDIDRFLAAAVDRWSGEPLPAPDPALKQQAEALADAALGHLEAGRHDEARADLARAAGLGRRAGAPRVYQYVANLAVLDRNLFLAVQSQIEALRLAPRNELYRRNLRSLLTTPWKDFHAQGQD